jgi:arylsulfatase A-like enzyme
MNKESGPVAVRLAGLKILCQQSPTMEPSVRTQLAKRNNFLDGSIAFQNRDVDPQQIVRDEVMPTLKSVCLALALCLAVTIPCPAESLRPNVVVFLADDAGWGDYSHSGNLQISTPHIDSIAASGVSLDRFYVCPVCSPTRAEFLTGRYHPRGGVYGTSTGQERLNLDESTLAEAFQQAGYATGAFGKWHNGSQWPYHPRARGFDEYVGHTSGHWGEYVDPPLEENGKMIRGRGYIADYCTDRALQFIDKNHDRSFFCYIPFTTPHSPWKAPDKNWNHFKEKPITQRASIPEKEVLDETRCALAMVENQDENVGRVLSKLDALGLTNNTIVVYFSDNGPSQFRWLGGMKGKKGSTDEGGVRSICFIKWPARLPAGHQVPQIAGAIDLLPTLLCLADVPRVGSKPLDGRDLTPLLTNSHSHWLERMIFSTWSGKISVRDQRYRLDHEGNLFDMTADPGQKSPVNQQFPEVAERLSTAASDWRKEMSALTPHDGLRRGNDRVVDPRPIPVGYRQFPTTMLPARDGEPHGEVHRSSPAPNCSYFVNWKSTQDQLIWRVEIHTAGRYAVTIDYTCPEGDAGSLIELRFQDARLTGRVAPAWDPPLYTNQDTLPRPRAESQMKEFHTLTLGEITLPQGKGELQLRALQIPDSSVMDLRRLTLTLLE